MILEDPASNASHHRAMEACVTVLDRIIDTDGRLRVPIPTGQFHHLQKLLYTCGALFHATGKGTLDAALEHYILAIELAVRPPAPYRDAECYSFMDVLLSTCLLGLFMTLAPGVAVPQSVLNALHVGSDILDKVFQCELHLLTLVQAAGRGLSDLVLPQGVFPTVLLLPEQAMRLCVLLFSNSLGVLPSICSKNNSRLDPPSEGMRQQTSFITSTIL